MTAPLDFWWLQDWNQLLLDATTVVVAGDSAPFVVTVAGAPAPVVVTVPNEPPFILTA